MDEHPPEGRSAPTLLSRERTCVHAWDINAHSPQSTLRAERPVLWHSIHPPSFTQRHSDDSLELEAQSLSRIQQSTNDDLETILNFLDNHSSGQERAGPSLQGNIEDDQPPPMRSRLVSSEFSNVIAFLGQQGLRPRTAVSGVRENRRSPKMRPQDITSAFSDVITFIQQQSLRPRDPKPAVIEKHEAPVPDRQLNSQTSNTLQDVLPNPLDQDTYLDYRSKCSSRDLPVDQTKHKSVDAMAHCAQMEEARAPHLTLALPLCISTVLPMDESAPRPPCPMQANGAHGVPVLDKPLKHQTPFASQVLNPSASQVGIEDPAVPFHIVDPVR
ncbi:hypothetical protein CVT26_013892 [Gymnopilus dilepis]|uniref:Uncharacterized protein n=1 Tax=Gymnopilus dilepis TaxID=231916 RepID=A0A409Y5U8_9AGAR|nr:hypothetical protein CVT26_013892 [Gymnopilus dilepis]